MSDQEQAKYRVIENIRGSLVKLGRAIMPKAFNTPSPLFHNELSDLILDQSKKLINIIAPRGSAKTTLAAVLATIHHIFLQETGGKKVVLICSRTTSHGVNVLRTIKNIFEYSSSFRALFGYWGQFKSDSWREDFIDFKKFAILIRGTGQMSRGLNIDGQRPTLIIVDDPEDENNTVTIEAMEKNFSWLNGAVVPSADAHIGRVIVIGTPLHERCIVLTLKKMKNWYTKHYSYLYDLEGEPIFTLTQGMRDNPDKLKSIWEEMKSVPTLLEEYEALKEAGKASIFHKERLCWVIGDEDALVEEQDLRYWKGNVEIVNRGEAYLNITSLNKKVLQIPKRLAVIIFGGIDPASSERRTADYSVGIWLAVDKDLNRYVLPMLRVRQKPMQLADSILRYDAKYKPIRTKIENIAYQEMLKEYVQSQRYIPGLAHQGSETKPRTSKTKRLFSLQPLFASGKIFFCEDDPNMKYMETEALNFPKSSHDDTLDALYYAAYRNYAPMHDVRDTRSKKEIAYEEGDLDTENWKTM